MLPDLLGIPRCISYVFKNKGREGTQCELRPASRVLQQRHQDAGVGGANFFTPAAGALTWNVDSQPSPRSADYESINCCES